MAQAQVAKPRTAPWPEYPVPSAWIESGQPQGRGMVVTQAPDGQSLCGQWEVTPGKFRWEYDCDEYIYLLAGKVAISVDGGEPFTMTAGDTAYFPRGSIAVWDVKETVRKVFFHQKAAPTAGH